ncbi:DUF2829 domain-containing protein [Bacillus cereus group sp. MYBK14-3]|uniref:DUF2829 domain-containing protein n=1 Tax=unclassified Bacillus cereus group TaxID=2750818 RepID=UPI003F793F69
MNFGFVIGALKNGKKVSREGWNGKGMWLCLITASEYKIETMKFLGEQLYQTSKLPWIGMRTADGSFVPWLASQTDMLAEDWEVVE